MPPRIPLTLRGVKCAFETWVNTWLDSGTIAHDWAHLLPARANHAAVTQLLPPKGWQKLSASAQTEGLSTTAQEKVEAMARESVSDAAPYTETQKHCTLLHRSLASASLFDFPTEWTAALTPCGVGLPCAKPQASSRLARLHYARHGLEVATLELVCGGDCW